MKNLGSLIKCRKITQIDWYLICCHNFDLKFLKKLSFFIFFICNFGLVWKLSNRTLNLRVAIFLLLTCFDFPASPCFWPNLLCSCFLSIISCFLFFSKSKTFISLLTVVSENHIFKNGDHCQKWNKTVTKHFLNQSLVMKFWKKTIRIVWHKTCHSFQAKMLK